MNNNIQKSSAQNDLTSDYTVPKWWKGLAKELQSDIELNYR